LRDLAGCRPDHLHVVPDALYRPRASSGQADPRWTTVKRIAAALDVGLADLGEAVERGR
jgi:hypothetical protein